MIVDVPPIDKFPLIVTSLLKIALGAKTLNELLTFKLLVVVTPDTFAFGCS